ncbi:hypothetical protein RND81_06G170500 [Saponaria officinalis]|uniref:Eukaryotic translation initiation factor 5B n=1 Tax=Saponaria officinalis TaxID=3572 RepID=A0AAW1KB08_SAPOF
MGKKKPTSREGDAPQQGGGGGRSKKKNLVIDDDEYSFEPDVPQESVTTEVVAPPGGAKKKGKNKNLKGAHSREDDDDDIKLEDEVEEADVSEIVFSGKKKSKGKKGGDNVIRKVSFDVLGDEDDVQSEEDEPIVSFQGKKKSSKGKKESAVTSFALLEDEDNEEEENVQSEEDESISARFEGKKKSSKGKKGSAVTSFALLEDEDNEEEENVQGGEDESISARFEGKKKSKGSKKSSGLFSASAFDIIGDEQQDEADSDVNADDDDDVVIKFTGKKKSSKKKGTGAAVPTNDVDENDVKPAQTTVVDENDVKPAQTTTVVPETSKNKKKKKKGARTVQEEEDLDKILAELGETFPTANSEPSVAPPPKSEEIDMPAEPVDVPLAEDDKEGEDHGVVESAAAKKKKKKKEKEKEKKAAAVAAEEKKAEVKNEKSKVADKKLPKHVREMQEALARRQEAEERKKREEEERLRKEEEERRKQEELERLAEEAKLRKKEREKEKLRLKKEAGKLLTAKQKEEQRRLEIMRNQFINNGSGLSLPSEGGAPGKRPIYTTKKSKSHQGRALDKEKSEEKAAVDIEPAESEKTEEVGMVDEEETAEVTDEVQESGAAKEEEVEDDDDDEDWDAKSWDDADLALPVKGAFEDEEAEALAQSAAKKEAKKVQSVVDAAPLPSEVKPVAVAKKAMPHPTSGQISESKQKVSDVEVSEKTGKEARLKKETTNQTTANEGDRDLRSPICCIMGHVDTGKTKLLDCIRGTNVQEGEAGGITQQIGATYFPAANIRERTKELKADAKLNVPGLLVIDTPGHESFTNLRSRGSGLCDIAILVVDIMHGLEPQTIESLNLLKMRNTEFIVALNKVDRLYGWKTCRNAPIIKALKQQTRDVQNEFNMRLVQIITQFKEQGLNTELYYKNKEMGETFSIVPTSAISGEGIPDMLLLLVQWTQKTMIKKLTFSNKVQCTVLEVKVIEGHGTTIDVVLVNGVLHEGDQIVVCGMQGPIVTTIRALLTPHPMKELRVKGTYLHHKEIKAAQGIKITAQGLEHAIAGTGLYVVGPDDDLERITDLAKEDMDSVMSRIDKSGEGVCVQASTLGSLEALLEFLKSPAVSIPVSAVSIGPVHKKDVMKAGVMLEKKKEFATILAFDVKVTPEAREYADEVGVKIFMADIIYHLFDQFKAYIDNIKEEKKKEAADEAVFPCVLKIMPNCVFNKKDPIVLGVDVLEGIAKVGTPICIPSQEFIDIGRIASIENNHKPVDIAKKGQKVAIKILGTNPEEQQKMFGRHFDIEDELVSHISRKSIDMLKANYRDDLSIEEWKLVVKLKTLFKIQ